MSPRKGQTGGTAFPDRREAGATCPAARKRPRRGCEGRHRRSAPALPHRPVRTASASRSWSSRPAPTALPARTVAGLSRSSALGGCHAHRPTCLDLVRRRLCTVHLPILTERSCPSAKPRIRSGCWSSASWTYSTRDTLEYRRHQRVTGAVAGIRLVAVSRQHQHPRVRRDLDPNLERRCALVAVRRIGNGVEVR